jgi:hypothetical protein
MKQQATAKEERKGRGTMKKFVMFVMLLGVIGTSACGSMKDIDQTVAGIPGINGPGTQDAAAIPYTPPVDTFTQKGCDSCYSRCSGAHNVASIGFELCNNNCVSDCLNK